MDRDAEVEELPESIEVANLSSKAQFDDLIVWGHESTADSTTDPYLRSIEEWISYSEQVRFLHPSKMIEWWAHFIPSTGTLISAVQISSKLGSVAGEDRLDNLCIVVAFWIYI
jgi:hypothetical protein